VTSHFDFRRDEKLGTWLAWCPRRRVWAVVRKGKCAGCGYDVRDRFKPGVLEDAA
jgi:hypothetical protein